MLHAPTDLHRSQQLIRNSERLMNRAVSCLEQSSELVKRGKARAVARSCAAMTYEETYETHTQGTTVA